MHQLYDTLHSNGNKNWQFFVQCQWSPWCTRRGLCFMNWPGTHMTPVQCRVLCDFSCGRLAWQKRNPPGRDWVCPKTSVAPGQPSMLCLHFCFVLCRPWFPIFNPCYVINFKLEFLRPDRTKCLETWYHYCILPNLKNSLLQFLEKMSLLEDACLGLDFPFLALAMI